MKTKIAKKIFIFLLVFPLYLLAFEPAINLKFYKEIIPTDSKTDIFRIILDSDIYDSADDKLRNIRILNAQGKEIPFSTEILRETRSITLTESVSAKIANANKNGNTLELIVELPSLNKMHKITELQIYTPSKNFEKSVRIETSNDNINWEFLTASESIFDYSEFVPLSKTNINLPAHPPKLYYKLIIANFAEGKQSPRIELINEKRAGNDFSSIEKISINTELLKIDSIFFMVSKEQNSTDEEKNFEYKAVEFKTEEKQDHTEVIFSTRKEPLNEVILETDSANFARNCVVLAGEDGKNWELISQNQKIYSIYTSSFKSSNMQIELDGSRHRYYKISILNNDSPPIKVSGIKLYGYAHVLNFFASEFKNNSELKVYYGGNNAAPPKYDTEELIGKMKNPKISFVNTSPQKNNSQYSTKIRAKNFFENKILFYGALVLMLLCLTVIIYKSFKKIDALPPS